jgi:hypothetical protein
MNNNQTLYNYTGIFFQPAEKDLLQFEIYYFKYLFRVNPKNMGGKYGTRGTTQHTGMDG